MVAHNGEINTVKGNFNWMRAREGVMKSPVLGDDLKKLYPISFEGQSDTATFDNALELLTMSGYPLAHAAMMMIPEAWEQHELMDARRRAFYEYHAAMLEPWDGPAAMVFTDGKQIGATLDRNGLRPARYIVTDDDLVVMASESGVLRIPENRIVKKWRLQPGKMFLIDLEQGRIVDDEELKNQFAFAKPYRQWIENVRIRLDSIDVPDVAPPALERVAARPPAGLRLHPGRPEVPDDADGHQWGRRHRLDGQRLAAGGAVGQEQAALQLLQAAVRAGDEPADRPDPRGHRDVAEQLHRPEAEPAGHQRGQPADAPGGRTAGPRLRRHGAVACHREAHQRQVQELRARHHLPAGLGQRRRRGQTGVVVCRGGRCHPRWPQHPDHHRPRWVASNIAIPALLALSAIHHHLVREGLRTTAGLVVETGSAREVHHFAVLAGYGAEAVHPYLAMETLVELQQAGSLPADKAVYNYVKAIGKGLSKIMSKMGVSTYMSYCGAQLFEAIGLEKGFVEQYFRGTASQVGGIGVFEVAEEALRMHRAAFGADPVLANMLDAGGEYAWRTRGEEHMWTPDAIAKLQHSTRAGKFDTYKEYAQIINDQSKRHMTLRGLFEFKVEPAKAIPLDEVEPASEIVKRFATGAMSLGSISTEAHSTLAIAMNRIGGKSNTGEGGEDPARYRQELKGIPIAAGTKVSDIVGAKVIESDYEMKAGDSLRSKIKQVASGRFGVTTEYLVSADQIQIKMAQGAKPGEGGQLPGGKVSDYIGMLRYSVPGVGLISPPPHHDIYSIEDLAQLIHDLKNANPRASVSVKLVSEVGVGTIAAGVAKCKADHVVIAGHDGGTGASPWSSIKHAGTPWELGLAETQQTLVLNRLRGRIRVQADGQMKTGRDVVIGALLGADEFGFATAPLVVEGCIMMRKCHLNTCPVGVATQDPLLRKKFAGKPEHVVNYFFFVAEEARQIMAQLGIRKFDELIGRADLLDMKKGIAHWKARGLDFTRVLHQPVVAADVPRHQVDEQDHGLGKALDVKLIERCRPGHRAWREGPVHGGRTQRQPQRRGDAVGRVDPPPPGRPARPHHLHADGRHGRPELRRLPGQRHHAVPDRRRQRLHRQGPVGRPGRGAPEHRLPR
jgi:glutamate synthase (NADPH/NADH) large chain